jgi:hypothetical protein
MYAIVMLAYSTRFNSTRARFSTLVRLKRKRNSINNYLVVDLAVYPLDIWVFQSIIENLITLSGIQWKVDLKTN